MKLFDFGIVKATGRVSKTEAGVVKGNIAFMSPEQARGQPLDQRSDLFSLGLVIYYCLINEQIVPRHGDVRTADAGRLRTYGGAAGQAGGHARRGAECSAVRSPSIPRDATRAPPSSPPTSLRRRLANKAEAAALMRQLFGDELKPPTV